MIVMSIWVNKIKEKIFLMEVLDNRNLFGKIEEESARAFSSVGRASPLQGEGQKFESSNAHHKKRIGFSLILFLF